MKCPLDATETHDRISPMTPKLKTFLIQFHGRKAGAIGIFYPMIHRIEAETIEQARTIFGNDHTIERNRILHITEVESVNQTPTLPLSQQDVFNIVWNRAKDKRQATGETGSCYYRAPNGLQCFMGACIPDSLYDPAMEMRGAYSFQNGFPSTYSKIFGDLDPSFLSELQGIHDLRDPDEWDEFLRQFSIKNELSIPGEN